MKDCSGWLQYHQLRASVGEKDKVGITAPYPAKTRPLIPFREWAVLSKEDKTLRILRIHHYENLAKVAPRAPSL